ncbi:DUF418 domain-containing protein [soil metagenome]
MKTPSGFATITGLAVLGSLLVDLPGFAGPSFSSSVSAFPSTPNLAYDHISSALFAGRFVAILCVALGYWIAEHSARAKAAMGWLIVIGLFHGILVWHGSLISTLALTGLLAAGLLKISEKGLWTVAAGFAINTLFAVPVIVIALIVYHHTSLSADYDLGIIVNPFQPAEELRVFSGGLFAEQVQFRVIYYGMMIAQSLILAPLLLPFVLLGIQLQRLPESVNRLWKPWLLILASVLSFAAFIPVDTRTLIDLRSIWNLILGPIVGISLLVVFLKRGWRIPFVENIGKMPISIYILQSTLAAVFFYGFGFFGHSDPALWLLFVGFSSLICLAFASLWMSKFEYGPIEIAWKRLAKLSPTT